MRGWLPMQGYQVILLLALVAGCSSASGETSGPAPGSPAWYETASPKSITNHFRAQCVAYGYMPGTADMAKCIEKEAIAARQTNIARSAAIAAATAGH